MADLGEQIARWQVRDKALDEVLPAVDRERRRLARFDSDTALDIIVLERATERLAPVDKHFGGGTVDETAGALISVATIKCERTLASLGLQKEFA